MVKVAPGSQPLTRPGFALAFGLLLVLAAGACGTASPTPTPVATSAGQLATLPPTAPPASTPSPTSGSTSTLTPSPPAAASPAPTITPSATPCAAPGQVISGTFPSATAGTAQRYRIYLPPCYAEDGRVYPSVILMAGNIHDESKWHELGVDEAADTAIAAGIIPPLVLVMPDGGWLANNTSGGPGSYESLILEDLIPHVEADYCLWAEPAGRAIGGLSRGGYWALEIAFRFPQHFTSVAGHSAALLDQYAGPTLNPQSTGVSNDLGNLRVYLDIGADDYLRENTIRLHRDMEAAGVAHTWHLNEGRHEDAYWAAHLGDYLRWYAQPWPLARAAYPPCD